MIYSLWTFNQVFYQYFKFQLHFNMYLYRIYLKYIKTSILMGNLFEIVFVFVKIKPNRTYKRYIYPSYNNKERKINHLAANIWHVNCHIWTDIKCKLFHDKLWGVPCIWTILRGLPFCVLPKLLARSQKVQVQFPWWANYFQV